MIVIFGNSLKSAPSILPSDTVTLFGRVVPVDRFLLAGIVIVVAAALAALFRWTPFGLSTRAASENEVSAMLAGLSPSRLSLTNTVLASVVAGGSACSSRRSSRSTRRRSRSRSCPRSPPRSSPASRRSSSRASPALRSAWSSRCSIYWSTQSWFPTDEGGAPLRGLPELFVFLVIVLALFLRGASLPGRGELVEKRLPAVPRPERLLQAERDRGDRRRRLR